MKKTFLFLLLVLLVGCKSSSIFTDIGTNIASPSYISINAAGDRLYVVNSNDQAFYRPEQGSLQTYVLSLNANGVPYPAAAALKTSQITSLSSQMYIDVVNNLAYLANRYSVNADVSQDALFTIDFNEASADYLGVADGTPIQLDPYGVACCYPANRTWITSENFLQYLDLTTTAQVLSPVNLDMRVTLDNGSTVAQAEINFIQIFNNQAYISRLRGGVFIVNLDEVGVAGKQPVDYFLDGVDEPRDITTDGTNIYILNQGVVVDEYIPHILVVDPTKFPALTDNASPLYVDMSLDSDTPHASVVTTVEVEEDPQNIAITTGLGQNLAFVTCRENNKLSVVNTTTMQKQVEALDTGEYPYSMAFYAPAGTSEFLYVGNLYDNNFTIVKIDTNPTVVATYP
ncbi:MAG: hypothetical protein ABIE74_03175 [Pseudomonadota bacterium]